MHSHRHTLKRFFQAVALGCVFIYAPTSGNAETVVALPVSECREVRQTLETYVPIAPGFRQLEMPFPENQENINGTLCRLVAVGTGIHLENEQIRTRRARRNQMA